MDRDELREKIVELAEIAKSIGEPNSAIVLYTLSGSMHTGDDRLLAVNCQEFSKEMIEKLKALRDSSLN
jgi:hypothetical protein